MSSEGLKRKRGHWMVRGGRAPPPPIYPLAPPPESYFPPPQPVWPLQPPPQGDVQTDPDTTSDSLRKKKKKAIVVGNGTSKPWDREAAERALALENECQKNANAKSIVIRFPDPELSKEIVQGFHSSIDNVHFQGTCGARYCFVTLNDKSNVDKVMKEINKIKFGVGYLTAERKVQKPEENSSYESIDPYTLYVGNLALNITVLEVKEKFPSASRIDVGHAKKMKNTRYAFVKFATAEAALQAYKTSVNTIMASRSIIVRFRRHKGMLGHPGEKSSSTPEPKLPVERLTVGAKLKAKKDKALREAAAEAESSSSNVPGISIKDEIESDEEIEMENDDESLSEYDEGADFDIEDEDDDEMEQLEESEEEYELSGGEDYDDTDDDEQLEVNNEDDDYCDDDDGDCKDIFSLM